MSDKRHGVPNWVDCATTDLTAAEAFYASLFGWTSERDPGSDGTIYAVQRLNGKLVAGLFELSEEMRAAGVPPYWETSIEVADLGAVLERVKAEGGQVVFGPITEPGVGEMAAVADPLGAQFRLWTSEPGHGGEVFNIPGALTWNELATGDPEAAARFYTAVLGLTSERMHEDPNGYVVLKFEGEPIAGILQKPPQMGDLPDSWDVYFAVADVDAAVATAQAAGATVIRPAFDLPVGGRMAVLQDPQGAVFEVIKMGEGQA